jgi:hypothetical protein
MPSTKEAEIREDHGSRPVSEVSKTPSQPTSWAWWYVPLIPGMREAWVGGLRSEAGSRKKM